MKFARVSAKEMGQYEGHFLLISICLHFIVIVALSCQPTKSNKSNNEIIVEVGKLEIGMTVSGTYNFILNISAIEAFSIQREISFIPQDDALNIDLIT